MIRSESPLYRMLILDAQMPDHKGYGGIEERFPDTFHIDQDTTYNTKGYGKVGGRAFLMKHKYDIVLVGHDFPSQADQGIDIAEKIRNCPDIKQNTEAYIVGVSSEWREEDFGGLSGELTDVIIKGENPAELFDVLEEYLRLNGSS